MKVFIFAAFVLSTFISSVLKEPLSHTESCPVKCDECQKAIDKALAFLVTQVDANKFGQFDGLNSALAGLSFIAEGSTIQKGKYSKQIQQCVKNVVKWLSALKIPSSPASKPMDHVFFGFNSELALQVIFLCEIYKLKKDKEIEEALKKAENFFMQGRYTDSKAWGYCYTAKKSTGISTASHDYANMFSTHAVVTAFVQMRDAGIKINDEVLKDGITFMEKLQRKDEKLNRQGEFVYFDTQQNSQKGEYSPGGAGRTSGAIYALVREKKKISKILEASIEYLKKNFKSDYRYPGEIGKGKFGDEGDAYNLFFMALTMNVLGQETWDDFWKYFRDQLIKKQKKDGSWEEKTMNKVGPSYFTAINVFVFLLPRNNLPLISSVSKEIHTPQK